MKKSDSKKVKQDEAWAKKNGKLVDKRRFGKKQVRVYDVDGDLFEFVTRLSQASSS